MLNSIIKDGWLLGVRFSHVTFNEVDGSAALHCHVADYYSGTNDILIQLDDSERAKLADILRTAGTRWVREAYTLDK